MKREKNRILLTLKEAEEIEACLDSLSAMSGVYDENFNKECYCAEKYADKLMKLRNNKYVDESIGERLNYEEANRLIRFYRGFVIANTQLSKKLAETLENIFGKDFFNQKL